MILFIDTANFNHIHFAIIGKNAPSEVLETFKEFAFNENYKTAIFLEQFIKKHKIDLTKLKKIIVCSGPGSFSGIRVGVTLAQSLGFALNIPTFAITKDKIPTDLSRLPSIKADKKMTLHYGKAPNITKSKK